MFVWNGLRCGTSASARHTWSWTFDSTTAALPQLWLLGVVRLTHAEFYLVRSDPLVAQARWARLAVNICQVLSSVMAKGRNSTQFQSTIYPHHLLMTVHIWLETWLTYWFVVFNFAITMTDHTSSTTHGCVVWNVVRCGTSAWHTCSWTFDSYDV